MKYQFYRDFLKTAFAAHKPRYGDIISVNRGLYKHYGIYKNEQNVINFTPKNGFELKAKEADILNTTLAEFLKGGELCVERDNTGQAFSPDETVHRAEAQLGKHKGDYNLVFFNCEHFVRWCKYGELESHQVRNAVAGLAIGTAAIATALVIDSLGKKESRL